MPMTFRKDSSLTSHKNRPKDVRDKPSFLQNINKGFGATIVSHSQCL